MAFEYGQRSAHRIISPTKGKGSPVEGEGQSQFVGIEREEVVMFVENFILGLYYSKFRTYIPVDRNF